MSSLKSIPIPALSAALFMEASLIVLSFRAFSASFALLDAGPAPVIPMAASRHDPDESSVKEAATPTIA